MLRIDRGERRSRGAMLSEDVREEALGGALAFSF